MTKSRRSSIRLIYDILLSISIVAAGACLIAGCLVIYFGGGEQPYSREIVLQTLGNIAVPLIVCALLTVGGFVWDFLDAAPKQKLKVTADTPSLLARMYTKKDLASADEATRLALRKEQHRRRLHAVIRTVSVVIGSAVFAVYSFQPTNFSDTDINGSVIRAVTVACVCFLIPCIYAIVTAFINAKSYNRELALLKTVAAAPPAEESLPTRSREIAVLRTVLLTAALLFVIYGILAGGTADVLTKAINICTECIGLG